MDQHKTDSDSRPTYEPPMISVLSQDEVLRVFQMTAAEISAAGCWWSSTSWT